MSAQEVASSIASVDRRLRDGEPVEDSERSINLTGLYRRYDWGGARPKPLPSDAQKQLGLSDRSTDERWSKHIGGARHLAIYRSQVGYYWLLRYDSAMSEHWLEHVGTAFDVERQFGKRG